jgi:hypothetical protein
MLQELLPRLGCAKCVPPVAIIEPANYGAAPTSSIEVRMPSIKSRARRWSAYMAPRLTRVILPIVGVQLSSALYRKVGLRVSTKLAIWRASSTLLTAAPGSYQGA